MTEVWKLANDFYEVSNMGNVRNYVSKRILSQRKNNRGYFVVDMYLNKKRKSCLVHRLVAKAFLECSLEKIDVNHIDENKANNSSENLEWCTHKENVYKWCKNNSEKVGRKDFSQTEKYRKHNKKVIMFDDKNNILNVFNGISEVKKFLKRDTSCVVQCCDGKRKTAYGYKWKFAE